MFNIVKGLILLACVPLLIATTEAEPQKGIGKIMGGEEASYDNWPSIVALYEYDNNGYPICGGTLIRPEWIITAAHCLTNMKPTDMFVWLGTADLSENGGGESVKVKRVIIHPDYNKKAPFDSDLGLIQLQKSVSILPMQLYNGHIKEGTTVAVAGWGITKFDSNGNFYRSLLLQQLVMPVISLEECLDYQEDLTKNMICAGFVSPEKDACRGDSGGPLIASQNDNIRLAGLVSYGLTCNSPYRHSIGIYTRVSNFSSWIKSYTDKKSSTDSGGGSLVWVLSPLLGLLLLRKKYYLIKGM